mmetsp:Transcript_25645/g.57651  ORF Transcript_25645/g.57651 Transcript_25645/m.57651 type:complete len:131 (-) Transcript_25645:87-479(-)
MFVNHVEQIRGAVEIALKGWNVQVIVNDGKGATSEGSRCKLEQGCFELWLKWQCPVLRSVLLYRKSNSSDAMPDIFTLFSEILQVLETPLEDSLERQSGEEEMKEVKEEEKKKEQEQDIDVEGELRTQDL